MWFSAKFGTCTVVSIHGTLVEAHSSLNLRILSSKSVPFTGLGACAKYSTTYSHERITVYEYILWLYSYYPMLWCSKNAPAWCNTDWTTSAVAKQKWRHGFPRGHWPPRARDPCVLIGHSHLCLWYRDDGPSHPSTQLTRTRTPERTASTFFGC